MGAPDFRVGGRIFATLAMQHLGYGNLMLSPALQKVLMAEAPEVFLPIPGGWGRMGCTHIRLADATRNRCSKAFNSRGPCGSRKTAIRGRRNRDENAESHSVEMMPISETGASLCRVTQWHSVLRDNPPLPPWLVPRSRSAVHPWIRRAKSRSSFSLRSETAQNVIPDFVH